MYGLQIIKGNLRPGGTSQEIALPMRNWEMINIDFVIGPPRSRNQYDSIWVGENYVKLFI